MLALMMLTLIITILKLLVMIDLWFGEMDISNARHLKKRQQRINNSSMASKQNDKIGACQKVKGNMLHQWKIV